MLVSTVSIFRLISFHHRGVDHGDKTTHSSADYRLHANDTLYDVKRVLKQLFVAVVAQVLLQFPRQSLVNDLLLSIFPLLN